MRGGCVSCGACRPRVGLEDLRVSCGPRLVEFTGPIFRVGDARTRMIRHRLAQHSDSTLEGVDPTSDKFADRSGLRAHAARLPLGGTSRANTFVKLVRY